MNRIFLVSLLIVIRLNVCTGSMAQIDLEVIWQEGMEKSNDTTRIDFLLDQAWELARVKPGTSSEILARLDAEFYKRGIEYKLDVWYYYEGIIEKNLGRFATSDSFLQKYYDYQLAQADQRRLANVQMARANLYADQGLWSKSMEAVTESLQYYESLSDSLGIIRANSKLGAILTELQRLDDAMNYHRRSLNIATLLRDSAEIAIAYSNIGIIYEKQERLDTALFYYKLCLDIDRDIDDEYAQNYDRNNIANIYLKMNQPQQALPFSQAAFESAKKIGAPGLIHYSQNLLGSIYLDLNQTEKGISLINDLLETAEISKRDLSDIHGSLYLAYKKIGKIESAFYHLEKYHELFDTLLNEDITQQINSLEVRYQTEKKEQQLELANSENEIAQLKVRSIQNRNYFLFASLLLISAFLIYLFQLNNKIKSQNLIILKSLGEKDTLLKEIHHRVKNNLQVISSLLSLQSKAEENPNVVSALKLGQDRVRSMALIHQNLYEENNLSGIDVQKYFEKLISSLFHTYKVSANRIELKTEIDPLLLDVETMIPLGLIVNELITNALKYAFPNGRSGTVKVLLKEQEHLLHLEVSDDGIGMQQTPTSATKSFGYRLINTFKQQLKASLDVDGSHGTKVVMQINQYLKSRA